MPNLPEIDKQPDWYVPYTEWRGCQRKVRHSTEQKANDLLKQLNRVDLHSYFCEHCYGWHLGHIDKI